MGFSCYSIDQVSGTVSVRFWFRLVLAGLLGFEHFWYTSGFASDFSALFSQPMAFLKFAFLFSGSILALEWIYFSIRYLARRDGIYPFDWKLGGKLVGLVFVVPFVFLVLWGWVFGMVFGKEMAEFASAVSLVMVGMMLLCVGITCMLLYPPVVVEEITFEPIEVLKVEVFYGGVKVDLLAADIAYVFYKEGIYYITSHGGVCYETSLAQDFEGFYALLDPDRFFMINDFCIVSHKSVKDYEELEDGTLKVNLSPKLILPQAFREDGQPGLYDFLNWN